MKLHSKNLASKILLPKNAKPHLLCTSSVSITVSLGDKGDCLEIDICKVLPVEINILRNKSFAKVIPTFKLSDSFFRWFLKGSPKNPIVSKPLCMYCVPFLSF